MKNILANGFKSPLTTVAGAILAALVVLQEDIQGPEHIELLLGAAVAALGVVARIR